jgi:hypothetical protein
MTRGPRPTAAPEGPGGDDDYEQNGGGGSGFWEWLKETFGGKGGHGYGQQ